jgi:hypothetical protein
VYRHLSLLLVESCRKQVANDMRLLVVCVLRGRGGGAAGQGNGNFLNLAEHLGLTIAAKIIDKIAGTAFNAVQSVVCADRGQVPRMAPQLGGSC